MDFSEILEKRRAINFFAPEKDVSESELRRIVEDAAKAPSSFNLQPWNFMVLRERDEKTRLKKIAWDQPKITEAPVVLIMLADRDGWKAGNETFEKVFKKFIEIGKMTEDKHDWFADATKSLYGKSEEYAQGFACKNAGLFAMSLMYCASNMGIHTHPMDGFDHEAVRKEFNIPENYWIPMLIAVGHLKPGVEILPKGWRKSYDEMVKKF